MFGDDNFARDWSPSFIIDLLVAQNYPFVLIDSVLFDKLSAPPVGLEMVYVLTEMLRTHFFAYTFFVAHWFFFAEASIEHKVLDQWRPIYINSFLGSAFTKVPLVFFAEVLIYWTAYYAFPNMIGVDLENPGLGQAAVFIANQLALLILLLIFLWWVAFSISQSLINVVLVRIFILRRSNGKKD